MAEENNELPEGKGPDRPKGFWGRYGGNILLAVLVLYLLLLLTGTVAEMFHIDSILKWWIWRPATR